MRNLFASGLFSRIRFALVFVLAALIAGCGGGGGGGASGGSTSCPGGFIACSGSGSSGTGSGTGSTTTTSPKVTVSIVDGAGAVTTTLPSSGSVTVNATVTNAAGAAVSGAVVTFTTDSSLGTFSPASGTALTTNGVATIQMSVASLTAAGAAAVTAAATVDSIAVSGGATYQVGAANLALTNFTISKTEIDAYGTSTVAVTVNVNGQPTSSPLTVGLASGCASSGKATLASSVQTVNGVATATYTDKGCNSSDTITVTVLDKTVQGTIKSAGPAVANIQFVSATPGTIALKGTAGLVDVSTVTFKVVDATGNAVPSANVDFYLSNWTGGIKLDDKTQAQVDALTSPTGKVRKQTAADGTVSVTVQAGSNPTSVWVLAKLKDSTLETQSSKLVISTGLPTQDRFSLSVGTHNIEGWQHDGVQSSLTVYAFDRVGNPVPNGTTVNFVTEGAGVSPSPGVCSILDATCTVQFVSGERRPQGESVGVCLNDAGSQVPSTDVGAVASTCVYSGRVTVLAYANGEESFDDTNGDNLYQTTETHRRLGDAYVDSNEDGSWASTEQYFPFAGAIDNANTGANCPTNYIRYGTAKSKANTCNTTWGQAQVRRDQVIVLSGSAVSNIYALSRNSYIAAGERTVYVGDTFGGATGASCSASFDIRISDLNNNVLPAGTAIEVDTNNVQYLQAGTPDPVNVEVRIGNPKVLDTTIPGGTTHSVTLRGAKCISIPSGSLTLKATTPTENFISYIPVKVNEAESLTLTAKSSNVIATANGSLRATVTDADFGVNTATCAASFDLNLADMNGTLPTSSQLAAGPLGVVSGSVSYQIASTTPPAVSTAAAPASLSFITNAGGLTHRVSFQGTGCIATTTPPGSIDSTVTLAVPTTRGRLTYIPVTVRRLP